MPELQNAFSQGTEGLSVPGDHRRSIYFLPVNEDYSIVCQVTAVSEGIVTGIKIWDEGNREIFAQLKYQGSNDTPPDEAVEVGAYVVFHRVGDFNSQGTITFERHEETPTGASWVCFADRPGALEITDMGEGQGTDGTETLTMRTTEPDSFFYDSSPPYQAGRKYLGVRVPSDGVNPAYFLVFLAGYSDTETKEFSTVFSTVTFTTTVDTSGKFVDFEVS